MQKVIKVFVHAREVFLSAEFRTWRSQKSVEEEVVVSGQAPPQLPQ